MSKEHEATTQNRPFVDGLLYDCEGISKIIKRTYNTARKMAILLDENDIIPCYNLTPGSKKKARAFMGSDLNAYFSGQIDRDKNEEK